MTKPRNGTLKPLMADPSHCFGLWPKQCGSGRHLEDITRTLTTSALWVILLMKR